MFNIESLESTFDFILAEAILIMQIKNGKEKILNGIMKKLNPGGLFLSHELLLKEDDKELLDELTKTIKVNVSALTIDGWKDTIKSSGLKVINSDVGEITLLKPKDVLRDEGFYRTLKIVRNVIANKAIRKRIFAMKKLFQKNENKLGHIVICAEKPKIK
jgi:hypothetical protein